MIIWKGLGPNNLQLESLELRRIYNEMTMVFKIVHKFINLNESDLLTMCNTTHNSVTTRGHAFKLKKHVHLD